MMIRKIGIIFLMSIWIGAAFAVSMSLSQEEDYQKEEFVYDDHDKRDPLWPLVSSSGAIINYDKDLMIADMVLDGIMVENTGNNVAIINGMIVNLNDKIGVFIIKKINPDSVILQKGEETFTLKLKKEE